MLDYWLPPRCNGRLSTPRCRQGRYVRYLLSHDAVLLLRRAAHLRSGAGRLLPVRLCPPPRQSLSVPVAHPTHPHQQQERRRACTGAAWPIPKKVRRDSLSFGVRWVMRVGFLVRPTLLNACPLLCLISLVLCLLLLSSWLYKILYHQGHSTGIQHVNSFWPLVFVKTGSKFLFLELWEPILYCNSWWLV